VGERGGDGTGQRFRNHETGMGGGGIPKKVRLYWNSPFFIHYYI